MHFLPYYKCGVLHGLRHDTLELDLAAGLDVNLVVAKDANFRNCKGKRERESEL
jgi:hypothetical protein